MRKRREPGSTLPAARLAGEQSVGARSSTSATGQSGFGLSSLGDSPWGSEGAQSDDGCDGCSFVRGASTSSSTRKRAPRRGPPRAG
jgi:hypothetical protein